MSPISQPHQLPSPSQGDTPPTRATGLSDLPRELRDEIYALALTRSKPIRLDCDGNKQVCLHHGYLYVRKTQPKLDLAPSMLLANKQIYSEARSILYENNMFIVGGNESVYAKDQPLGPGSPFCSDQSKNCKHVRRLLHSLTYCSPAKGCYIYRDTQVAFMNMSPARMAKYLLPMVRGKVWIYTTKFGDSAAAAVDEAIDWMDSGYSSTTKWNSHVDEFHERLKAELKKLLTRS